MVPWCGLAAATENVLANMQTRSVRLRLSAPPGLFGVSRTMAAPGIVRKGQSPIDSRFVWRQTLAYFPDDNLSDGVAEQVSKGFFDVNNIPPYDTWVWMVRNVRTFEYDDGAKGETEANYLVAWVPPEFIPLARAGVDANPEGCILWLDTLDDEFVRSLRRLSFFQDALLRSP